jgi:hypothetical protein
MTELVKREESALVKVSGVSAELQEKIEEAKEALETFENLKLPAIKFIDGKFQFAEGEEPIEAFECVLIYTKASNIYFKKSYRPGQVELPACYSADGRKPVDPAPNGDKPQAPACKDCAQNKFGSSATGDGKACRNVRPVYVLVDNAIMPRILRIPPTSLRMIEQYALGTVADCGSYMAVKTIVSGYKKDAQQTYFNIKFTKGAKLTDQEKMDAKAIRDLWLPMMKSVSADMEALEDDLMPHVAPSTDAPAPQSAATYPNQDADPSMTPF